MYLPSRVHALRARIFFLYQSTDIRWAVHKSTYSFAEYLQLEETAAYKNEYQDGEIVPMEVMVQLVQLLT